MDSQHGTAHHLGYRPEIDGLRAIAVVAVLLFHVGLPQLPGGYVGVDVFFVISGYLITRLVRRDVEQGRFSFKRFYARRVRRLMPALALVTLCSVPLSWWLLYPEDLYSYAWSLALQPLSLQNFFFLADGEYFRGAESKPLLHTWSLAVEEQFYLFWPLLLVMGARWRRRTSTVLFVSLLLASFIVNVAMLKISPKASFFMLPPRAWELGAGAAVAFLEERGVFGSLSRTLRSVVCCFGLALIGVSMTLFSSRTAFPGFAAVMPVMGSALCLLSLCGDAPPLRRVLGNRVVVHLGLISYPLYLWHWPVLVFWRYGRVGGDALVDAFLVLAVSGALAELTYRFVEQPVRRRLRFETDAGLVRFALVGAAVLATLGAHGALTEGAAYRFSGVARALLTAPFRAHSDRCGVVFRTVHPLDQVCPIVEGRAAPGERRVLVWGNSHADMWTGTLEQLARQHGAALFLNARNCRPTVDNAFCGRAVQSDILSFIARERVTDVLLVASWYGHYRVPDDVFESELEHVVRQLARDGRRIWLVVDTPSGAALDPLVAFRRSPASPSFGSVSAAVETTRRQRERALFERFSRAHPGVAIIDPTRALCDATHCWGGHGDVAWYRDADHLTDAGAARARADFVPVFISPRAH